MTIGVTFVCLAFVFVLLCNHNSMNCNSLHQCLPTVVQDLSPGAVLFVDLQRALDAVALYCEDLTADEDLFVGSDPAELVFALAETIKFVAMTELAASDLDMESEPR